MNFLAVRQLPIRTGLQQADIFGAALDLDFFKLLPIQLDDRLVAPIEQGPPRFFGNLFIHDENRVAGRITRVVLVFLGGFSDQQYPIGFGLAVVQSEFKRR